MELFALILEMEKKGIVTRTFRRLDPQRQQELAAAILEEAVEAGPVDVNMQHVAERSNAAVGSLYQYFGSRENLLSFAMELVVSSTVETFNSYRPYLAQMPLREALSAYITGGIEWTQEQRNVARFFARAAYQGDTGLSARVVEPIARVMTDMMRDILQGAQARGEIRADLDLEAATRVVNTLMTALGDAQLLPTLNTYYQLTSDVISIERIMEMALGMVEYGLKGGKVE